jgi:hypothetical protein
MSLLGGVMLMPVFESVVVCVTSSMLIYPMNVWECGCSSMFELAFMSWQSVSADGNKYTIPSIETGESISD